jgi:hypothetical protein
MILTTYRIRVDAVIHGAAAPMLDVTAEGGRVGDTRLVVSGSPDLVRPIYFFRGPRLSPSSEVREGPSPSFLTIPLAGRPTPFSRNPSRRSEGPRRMQNTRNLPALRALFALLVSSLLILLSCFDDKSSEPEQDPPVADWWTVDDCADGSAYALTGTKWADLQPVFCFSSSVPEAWRGTIEVAAATWNAVGSRLQIMVNRTPVSNTYGRDGLSVVSVGLVAEQPTALGVTYCWLQGTTHTEVDIVFSSVRPITLGGSSDSGPAPVACRVRTF